MGGGTQYVGPWQGESLGSGGHLQGPCLSHRGMVPLEVLRSNRARVVLGVPGTLGP